MFDIDVLYSAWCLSYCLVFDIGVSYLIPGTNYVMLDI